MRCGIGGAGAGPCHSESPILIGGRRISPVVLVARRATYELQGCFASFSTTAFSHVIYNKFIRPGNDTLSRHRLSF
jgi:hypothetical protein